MKRIILLISLLSSMLMAAEQCNIPGNPSGSCTQEGYVCNLAIDVRQNQKVMAFYLYDDAACTQPSTTTLKTLIEGTTTQSESVRPFMIEGATYDTDALAMTLAGSVALSAYNNRTKVSIIYSKVSENQYGGLRLNAISTMP